MKHLMNLFGMTVIALFFYFLLTVIEAQYLLPQNIIPVAGVRLDQWMGSFRSWGGVGILMSWVASILWYVVAQWVFRVNNFSDTGKRGVWGLFSLIPLAAVVAAFIFTREAQAGMMFAYVLYFANALLCYYLSTVYFSPASHKYVPPLASSLRPLLR